MSQKSMVLQAYNNQLSEFFDDVLRIFPDKIDIIKTKNYVTTIRKMNPRLIIQLWKSFICEQYAEAIEKCDFDYFMTKDYRNDVKLLDDAEKIVSAIDELRHSLRQMSDEDRITSMKYVQNLSKLANMYAML